MYSESFYLTYNNGKVYFIDEIKEIIFGVDINKAMSEEIIISLQDEFINDYNLIISTNILIDTKKMNMKNYMYVFDDYVIDDSILPFFSCEKYVCFRIMCDIYEKIKYKYVYITYYAVGDKYKHKINIYKKVKEYSI